MPSDPASASETNPERPFNITEKDFLKASQARLRAETALEEKHEEVERLQCLLRDIKHENLDLTSQLRKTQEELNETQASFGHAVAATRPLNMQKESFNAIPGSPACPDTSIKRAHLSSPEIIETLSSSQEQGKGEELHSTGPAHVSMPSREPPVQEEADSGVFDVDGMDLGNELFSL